MGQDSQANINHEEAHSAAEVKKSGVSSFKHDLWDDLRANCIDGLHYIFIKLSGNTFLFLTE